MSIVAIQEFDILPNNFFTTSSSTAYGGPILKSNKYIRLN